MTKIQITRKGYKIGEVSTMLGLPCSVLRFWESEFPQLRPFKTKGGQRLYSEADVQVVKEIQKLLYDEKYTISGAKKELSKREDRASAGSDLKPPINANPTPLYEEVLTSTRRNLEQLLDLLK